MDFKSLYCFTEVVRQKSFSAAAQTLNLTQPSVSKIVSQLENELGVLLLHKESGRKKRQVETTPIGEEVYRHALTILHERDLLLDRINDYRQVKTGTLQLGVSRLGGDLLGGAFLRFYRQWPQIELSFFEEGSLAIEQALRNNELDAGQLLAPVHSDFDTVSLCDSPLMIVMPREKARNNTQIRLSSLQHEPFILFSAGFSLNCLIQTACEQQGFTPNVVCRTSQWDLLANMVESGMGIAVLPEHYARKMNSQTFAALHLTDPALRWHLTLAWKKHRRPSPALRAWLDCVRTEFAEFRDENAV